MLIANQSTTRSQMENSSQQIENGRYAMQLLRDDIEHAGFYGTFAPTLTTAYTLPADPCLTTGNLGWTAATPSVPIPIYGYPGASTAPAIVPTCVTNRLAGTAILVVNRTATTYPPVAAASAVAGTTYLQVSECGTNTEAPFVVGTSGFSLHQKDCAGFAPLYPYIVRIYYISSCDVCGTDNIPTLKVVEFTGGTQTIIPLVEGIQNMQFDYGVASSTASGTPSAYTNTPAVTDWQNIMTVRVGLLAQNLKITPGYSDSKQYQLSGVSGVAAVGQFNDAYKRHLYNEVVRVVNASDRRETQ